ncbi:hypothetical protein ACILE9_11080 [Capnocytophaga cynodegmi]|uniref:hypothetical protein n=1 Tax=Capnocytophaga cynodegmi TaxID=28189 RepID=UPI0037D2F4CC
MVIEIVCFLVEIGNFLSKLNWESIITILISVLAIYCPYKIEVNRKKKEEDELIKTDNELFKESLSILKTELSSQIDFLENYLENKEYKLSINPSLQIDFLKFIDLKSIYKKNKEEDKKKQLNNLISALYSLSQFNESLIRTFESFLKRYGAFEITFLSKYRKVIYDRCYEITKNYSEIPESPDSIIIEDEFVSQYFSISNQFNEKVADEKGKADRKKIAEELFKLMELSAKYLFKQDEAIEINKLANEAYTAYIEMKNVEQIHNREVESHLKILKKAEKEISEYLKVN